MPLHRYPMPYRLILAFVLAFAGMVVGIEGLRNAVAWWRGVLPAPSLLEWASMVALPLLGWLWWRYLSPFGNGRGQCLAASCQRDDAPAAPASPAIAPRPPRRTRL